MKGEEVCFFCCFYWFGKMWFFAYIPKKGSKSCSSPQKFIWWVGLILRF